MDYSSLIAASQLEFARLATEVARRTGGRSIDNVELLEADEGLRFVCADIGGEAVVHALDLPPNAWNAALGAELVKLFRGSAQLALRQLGRATA